jgi:hypothetical protein
MMSRQARASTVVMRLGPVRSGRAAPPETAPVAVAAQEHGDLGVGTDPLRDRIGSAVHQVAVWAVEHLQRHRRR